MIYKLVFKNTVLFLFLTLVSCGNSQTTIKKQEPQTKQIVSEKAPQNTFFKTGAQNFDAYLPLLKDKKVGIVTNQTGILSASIHLVDFFIMSKVNLQKL